MASQSHISELRDYATGFVGRCKTSRWFGAIFHATVIVDIVADEIVTHEKIEQDAYSAEQLDLEAIKALDAGDIALARRLVTRSAEADRKIGALAHV